MEAKLGEPNSDFSDEKRSAYLIYECKIDYDDADAVTFIEFFTGPFPERIKLQLYGIDPFQIGADKLVALLKEKNDGLVDGGDGGFSYSFLNSSVGIWRDAREKMCRNGSKKRRRMASMRSTGSGSKKNWRNPRTIGPSGLECQATIPSRKNYDAALASGWFNKRYNGSWIGSDGGEGRPREKGRTDREQPAYSWIYP